MPQSRANRRRKCSLFDDERSQQTATSQLCDAQYDPPMGNLLRVLVADDDRQVAASLTALLRHEGFEVRGVYNGADALKEVRDFMPDVVVLDISMPRLSGYEVARMLKHEYGEKAPMLIAVTGSKQSDKPLSELVGFDHHFSKPYDVRAVLAVISEVRARS
jgi:CheY-like chemotaxis protein